MRLEKQKKEEKKMNEYKDSKFSVAVSIFLLISLFVFMGQDQPSGGLGVSGCEGCGSEDAAKKKCQNDSDCVKRLGAGYFCDKTLKVCVQLKVVKEDKDYKCEYDSVPGSGQCNPPEGSCYFVTKTYNNGKVTIGYQPSDCVLYCCPPNIAKPEQ